MIAIAVPDVAAKFMTSDKPSKGSSRFKPARPTFPESLARLTSLRSVDSEQSHPLPTYLHGICIDNLRIPTQFPM